MAAVPMRRHCLLRWTAILIMLLCAGMSDAESPEASVECSVIQGETDDLFPLAGDRGRLGVRGLRKSEDFAALDPEAELSSAEDFTVHYFRTFKVVRNLRMGETYVLYQCGTDAPSGQELETALQEAGLAADATYKTFSIPLRSVAVTDTVPLAMLEDLGLHPRVQFLPGFSASSCSQMLLGCQDAPFDTSNSSHVDSVDAIFKSDSPDWPGDHPPEVDPKVVQFSASQDPGALARAEWHKFIGLFFNKDLAAERLFKLVAANFKSHAQLAANSDGEPPVIAWCTYNALSSWNTIESVQCFTGGAYQYKKDLAEAAGASLLGAGGDDSGSVKFELDAESGVSDLLNFLSGADIVVDETYTWDNDGYLLDTFKQNYKLNGTDLATYRFLENEAVLRVDKAIGETTGGLDWFEDAIGRPDVVAKDLFQFTYPTLGDDGYEPHFIRNIAKDELTKKLLVADCEISSCDEVYVQRTNPICPLDAKLCSDGDSYVVPVFRNASANCEFTTHCDFPGMKDRQPLECARRDDDNFGGRRDENSDDKFFPLIFDGDRIKRDDIEDGTEIGDPKALISEAQDFAIVYYGSFKVVVNKRMKEVYILYQCGLFPPLVEQLQERLRDELGLSELTGFKPPKFFSIPLQTIAVESTVPIAMMEDLNLHPRISFLPSFVASSCSQKLFECQDAPLNYTHLESNPNDLDAVFRSDTPDWPGSYPASLEHKVIQFSATQDEGALNRAEWYKFLGVFFNQDLEAEQLFEEVSASFSTHAEQARAAAGDAKKVVAWCTFNAASNWNPVAQVQCHTGGIYQYKLDLVEAAGGELLDSVQSDGNSVQFTLDNEAGIAALLEHLAQADIVIDETYSFDNDGYTLESFKQGYQLEGADNAQFPFLASRNVWRLDKAIGGVTGGLDWFQTAVARPDLVLLDLISFVTPEASSGQHETHFMRNIAVEELTMPALPDNCPEKSCGDFAEEIVTAPICPLDIGLCADGGFRFRDPGLNCSFTECPRPIAPIDDADKVTLIDVTFTISSMVSADWTDVTAAEFKRLLSQAFSLPDTDRIHVICTSPGLVVQAQVVYAQDDTTHIEYLMDNLASMASSIFEDSELGSVTATVDGTMDLTAAEYEEMMQDSNDQCSAASPVPFAMTVPALAAVAAALATLLMA